VRSRLPPVMEQSATCIWLWIINHSALQRPVKAATQHYVMGHITLCQRHLDKVYTPDIGGKSMHTVVRSSPIRSEAVKADATRITTTLYDLIATMHTIVESNEDEWVVMAVNHLLRESRATFVENIDTLAERLL
jgi:hypothetical protein